MPTNDIKILKLDAGGVWQEFNLTAVANQVVGFDGAIAPIMTALPVKATGAELDTGTDDLKFANAKALLDSKYINESQLQNGGLIYAADAGTTDAYAITLSPVPAAYVTGMVVHFKANTVNTGIATLNVNALGVKTIKKQYNVDLADGDIKAGQLCSVFYDGINFQLLSPISNVGGGSTPVHVKLTSSFSTNSGTMVDVTGMSVNITAGKTYYVEIEFRGTGDGSTITLYTQLMAATSTITIYGIVAEYSDAGIPISGTRAAFIGASTAYIMNSGALGRKFSMANFIITVTGLNGTLKMQAFVDPPGGVSGSVESPTMMTVTEVT